MQVASVHHEYGRLTLATAGLLFQPGAMQNTNEWGLPIITQCFMRMSDICT